jgi:hypothetical protein
MKTAVVILNWNTKGFLERFLPGLLDSVRGLDASVIVADSASTDGSMEMMQERFPDVRRIVLDNNYGFTGGYNRALAQVESEYYVLINSDIEVTPGWLEPLTGWMDSHPDCGACGPKLRSWQDRGRFEYAGAAGGRLDRWGYPFCRGRILSRTEEDRGQYDAPADVFWTTGACLMTRSALWHGMGGLDDRFFAHMEEIDYCWRLQLEGWRVCSVPSSVVYHVGGGTLPQSSPWKLKLNYRNNLLMLDNNLAQTYMTFGETPQKAFAHARRTIFQRKCLDGCAAAAYLLSGRFKAFRAVWDAHREAGRLRRGADAGALAQWRETHPSARIAGLYRGSVVLASLLKGKRVFDYIETKMVL